jgi:hypothetical protein
MKHRYLALSASLFLLPAGCGFSDEGLAVEAATPAPGGGTGGRPAGPPATGGTGGQSSPPEGRPPQPPMSPDASAPSDASAAPVDAPIPDAAVQERDGGQAVNSLPPDAARPAEPDPCPRDQESLRLCLRFEDNLRDDSANARAVDGEQLSYEPGPSSTGRAARLDADSSIRVPGAEGLDLTTFTIEAWIKLDQLPPSGGRVSVVDKDGRYGMFVMPNGSLGCSARGSLAMTGPNVVPASQWVSLACTANENSVAAWVAGTRRAEADSPAMLGALMPGLAIGSNMPSGDSLVGSIDNLRIWSRVLASQEICAFSLGCPSP